MRREQSAKLAALLPEQAERYRQAGGPPQLEPALEGYSHTIFSDGAVRGCVKAFGMFLIGVIRGNDREAERALRRSVELGLTREEYVDGLFAGVLSRGVSVMWRGLEWSEVVPGHGGGQAWQPDLVAISEPERLKYFTEVYGELPDWFEPLRRGAPEVFEAYADMRRVVLTDGPLRRAEKELMLVSINAVERYEFGLLHHMRGAYLGGAGRAEVSEAIAVGIAAGGMPAWFVASPVLDRVEAEFEDKG